MVKTSVVQDPVGEMVMNLREAERVFQCGKVRLKGRTLDPDPKPSLKSRPWLVFLHEALGSIRLWRDVPRELSAATGLPALVFERQGHGDSDPLEPPRAVSYLHDQASEVLPSVLDQCGIEKAILVGHSDGGSIALLFAAQFPEQVVGVISEAAHVFVEEETLAGIREAAVAYRETELRSKLMRYHGENTDLIFSAWQDTWLSDRFRDWNIEAYLPEITVPILVIQGQDDAYGTYAQVEAICDGVAGKTDVLWVPDCGHEPHRQAKESVLPEMISFIKTLIP